MATVQMLFGIAPAIAPMIGGLLLGFHWQGIFIFLALYAAVSIYMGSKILPETMTKNMLVPITFKSIIVRYKSLLTNKEFILLIFGTGEQQKYLTNLIEKNKVNTNIFLMGYSKDIYFYMKRAEAFILSSLWEDPGFVIIESALSNLPIISSNCKNGPSEFLQNGRAGILFENNKKGELKKSLDIFMSQKAKMSNKKILAKKNSLNYTLFRHYKLFNKILIE